MKFEMDNAIKFLESMNLRRFMWLVFVGAFFLFGLSVFEKYTEYFRLSRLSQSTELLSKLSVIDANKLDPSLRLTYSSVKDELSKIVLRERVGEQMVDTLFERAMKFIFGAGPMFLLMVAGVYGMRGTKHALKLTVILLFLLAEAFFGWIGTLLPTIWWPYFNLFI